jgi:2'-hydroxyisoflavone reductase
MKILILGGTQFVGRHIIEAAQARDHRVTLFNRGRTNAELYPQVEKLRGDRDGALDALRGRAWDAVIDTSGYVPRIVGQSAGLLRDAVQRYLFISTISVYASLAEPGVNEDSALATLADYSVEAITGETYGGLKVLCERTVQDAYGARALIVRPGLIVGPHDPTHRFTYWPARMADADRCGGEVLAPDEPGHLTQFIDARDLAEWCVRLLEADAAGVYNATGPDYPLTLGAVFAACRAAAGTDVRFTWADEDFLLAQGVIPFRDLPLWVPVSEAGFGAVDISRALAAGLTFRPLDVTARDTLAWYAGRSAAEQAASAERAGLSAAREAELLAEWHARQA